MHGQFSPSPVTRNTDAANPQSESVGFGLDPNSLNLTEGIELNLEIQVSLDMTYVDPDGLSGNEADSGILELNGIQIGSKESPIDVNNVRNENLFEPNELALVQNLFIDVDPVQGMFITIEEIGDDQGNGIDIGIQDIFLGTREKSAGGLLIEDISNFVRDDKLAQHNQLFSMGLQTLDDGKNTELGNWIEFRSQVLTEEVGNTTSVSVPDLGSLNENLPGFGANTTIDASFALYIDKFAWIDSDEQGVNREFGLAAIMIYDGLDTNGDGIDDTVGPAKLSEMKIETVDHVSYDGRNVQALYIENLDFKADISIASIYVGDPVTGSLGALQIQGIDTAGTSVWIYEH
ncbi:hypothetical protein RED65_11670 [Oceanobacter sp. RED65]|uniref:Uncharacterized protein n=2 Tax=Bermanella marisrubri TaxID=207949 RepID=Q1N154_9GAMM|nr:hypothetical protein RED65_11670 [Oceanobacter sp. RED65] [Bermanella marisrubri]